VSIGLNCAEPVFNEGTACVVTAGFYGAAPPCTPGAPFTPTSLSYRIDDINSGAPIVALTTLTPAETVSIQVTGAQNSLLSDMRYVEDHQLTIEVTDSYGNTANAAIRWLVKRIFPSIT
jgi:hypothetical protein